MQKNITVSLEKINITGPFKKNGIDYYIIQNIQNNQYFEFGENETTLLALLKKNQLEEAKKYSYSIYNGNFINDFIKSLIDNNVISETEDSPTKKTSDLAISLPYINVLLNSIDISAPIYSRMYRVINFTLIAIATYLSYIAIKNIEVMTLISLNTIIGTIILLIPTIFIHEIGHALRLRLLDKKVHNIRLFFNYLSFEFGLQADVSESYKLKNRLDKIAVSFAGCYTQLAFGGIVALFLYFTNISNSNNILIVYTISNIILALTNLIPFSKLDGYWILSHYLNINNLSSKARNLLKDAIRIKLLKLDSKFDNYKNDNMENRKVFFSIYGLLDGVYSTAGITLIIIFMNVYFGSSISFITVILLCIILYKLSNFIVSTVS